MVSRIDLESTLGANALHLLVKLRGRSCGTTQLRDEMLVVGVPSAEEHLNVTDWQFLRLRLFLLLVGALSEGIKLELKVVLDCNLTPQTRMKD